MRFIENYYFRQVDVNKAYKEHSNLIAALRDNDKTRALRSLERNWRYSLEQLQKYL